MVLPDPGGPTKRRLCPPAAAISSARRGTSWPRTSERSSPPGSSDADADAHADADVVVVVAVDVNVVVNLVAVAVVSVDAHDSDYDYV